MDETKEFFGPHIRDQHESTAVVADTSHVGVCYG